jgi:hypothetical protein
LTYFCATSSTSYQGGDMIASKDLRTFLVISIMVFVLLMTALRPHFSRNDWKMVEGSAYMQDLKCSLKFFKSDCTCSSCPNTKTKTFLLGCEIVFFGILQPLVRRCTLHCRDCTALHVVTEAANLPPDRLNSLPLNLNVMSTSILGVHQSLNIIFGIDLVKKR